MEGPEGMRYLSTAEGFTSSQLSQALAGKDCNPKYGGYAFFTRLPLQQLRIPVHEFLYCTDGTSASHAQN